MAVALTTIGVVFDAGDTNSALGGAFAACYVLGCLAAVLAVRQSGIFTAVIQPPLILFVAVPSAYFVFHGSTFTGIKDTLINCGYPLIERFPLMFFTSATVLVVGLVRWYLGTLATRALPKDGEQAAEPLDDVAAAADELAAKPRRSARSTSARAARGTADPLEPIEDDAPRPRRARTSSTGSERPSAAGERRPRRPRASGPAETEIIEPVLDRPRRRSTAPEDSPAEPRRRPRSTEARTREPREAREPRERRPRPPVERRASSADRDRPDRERPDRERPDRDRRERPQRRERPESFERPERRRPRSTDYEPYEPYEPPVTRSSAGTGTHHPISRVRYRGSEDEDSRTEHRTRPRRPRHSAPDSWEYDA